jgi:hypothetical protein
MRVAVLAIASLIVLALGGSEAAVAQDNSSLSPPSMTAKAAPEQSVKKQSVKKQVTGRAKESTKASPDLERANSPDRDPVLRLLWFLTGSSRRR